MSASLASTPQRTGVVRRLQAAGRAPEGVAAKASLEINSSCMRVVSDFGAQPSSASSIGGNVAARKAA